MFPSSSSCWHSCQLPFSQFPVLLGVCGMGGERRCMHQKRETQSSALQSEVCLATCASSRCSLTSPLDHGSSKPGRWQGWQVTVLGTWGHLRCRGEDPSPTMQSQPAFAFRVLLLCQRHFLIARCTEQPDDDGHICDLYFSLGLLSVWNT